MFSSHRIKLLEEENVRLWKAINRLESKICCLQGQHFWEVRGDIYKGAHIGCKYCPKKKEESA